MNNQEIWKEIPNYDGLYMASNLGRVKSLYFGKVRIMKTRLGTNGYYEVGLRNNGKRKTFRVHQLVAMAFLNHSPNGYSLVVDHIDNNKANNNLKNLQVISQRENGSKDRKNTYSNYTGVSYHKRDKKWVASIKIEGKATHIGYFDTELDAARSYKKKLNGICQK